MFEINLDNTETGYTMNSKSLLSSILEIIQNIIKTVAMDNQLPSMSWDKGDIKVQRIEGAPNNNPSKSARYLEVTLNWRYFMKHFIFNKPLTMVISG